MTYKEYLSCAEKHLKGCTTLLNSYNSGKSTDIHVWLELYYMAGYIIEGITIYSAYKLYQWNPNDDIQKHYNLAFSQRTNLDFYYVRSYKDKITGLEKIPSFFQNRPSGAMSVQGHKFQTIILNLLKPDPSFNDTPYLGNGSIDNDIEMLLNNWSPSIRYYYLGQSSPLPVLSYDVIKRLIDTCQTIYIKHI